MNFYKIKEFFDIPYHIRKVKWFLQRGFRGWADCDVWDFDHYLSRVISGGLEHLSRNNHGFPCTMQKRLFNKGMIENLTQDENDKCAEEWTNILLNTSELFKRFDNWGDHEIDYLEKNVTGYREFLREPFGNHKVSYNEKEWHAAIEDLNKEYKKLLSDMLKSLKWFQNWWD
jgi:hypothetical protein